MQQLTPKVFLSLLMILFGAAQVLAAGPYQVTTVNLNHRLYEDPALGEFNRLAVYLQDDQGNFPQEDLLEEIILLDPYGQEVTLPSKRFSHDKYLDCSYDPNTSQWGYNTTVKEESVYYYDFTGPLIPGIYYLVVTFDGFTSESSRLYNGQVTLPVVRAAAVKLPKSLDPSGHLIITWTPGNELFQLSAANPRLYTQEHAIITIYREGDYYADFMVRVPTHMGRLFVPNPMVNWLKGQGDKFEFFVRLRTSDNNNRVYSKSIDITHLILPSEKCFEELQKWIEE